MSFNDQDTTNIQLTFLNISGLGLLFYADLSENYLYRTFDYFTRTNVDFIGPGANFTTKMPKPRRKAAESPKSLKLNKVPNNNKLEPIYLVFAFATLLTIASYYIYCEKATA